MLKQKKLNASHTSESQSSISRSLKSAHSTTSRYRWPSTWTYIASVMAFSCSVIYFDVLLVKHKINDINIVHYIVAFIFVGLPLHYLQILLGQYTQMGVSLIRYLSPIGHGIAISYITIMFINCVKNGLLLADVSIYFLSSMRVDLQWMQCPSSINTCWNGTGCLKNCLSTTIRTSTYYYFVFIYMENAELNPNTTHIIGIPSLSRTVLITSSWITTSLVLVIVLSFHKKFSVAVWNISFCLIVFNVFTSILYNRENLVIKFAFQINKDNLLDSMIVCMNWEDSRRSENVRVQYKTMAAWVAVYEDAIEDFLRTSSPVPNYSLRSFLAVGFQIWARAFTRPILYLGLGRAYHIMHGSYMSPNASSGIMASCLIAFNFTIVYLCSLFVKGRLLALAKFAHLDEENIGVLWEPGIVTYFINIPMSFGLLSVPHFWLLQYFLLCVLLLLNNQITHIIALETILSERYPVLIRYRRYILGSIALSAGLISIGLSSKETYLLYKSVSSHITEAIELSNAFALSILICYIHGVQKFCDDIHFMKGAQPSNFWKICWYALPIILSFSQYQLSLVGKSVTNVIETIDKWVFYILISPIPAAAIIEAFRSIKKRNILGLFQSEETYGPPDPKERYLRRLFNPRKETCAQRKSETCYHECLLNSKVLKRLIQEELVFKQSTSENK